MLSLHVKFVTDGQWKTVKQCVPALSPARWHDKHTYLSSLGMLGTTQLNVFADHIIFNSGYMKHAHSWQRMTNNNNNNKRKQV